MKRVIYKVIPYDEIRSMVVFPLSDKKKRQESIEKFEAWLNSYGREGWHLVGQGDEAMIFEKEEDAES